MAQITSDNIQITSSTPSGATIATDYVSDAHFQEVKINTGAAGADSILSNNAPLPIAYTTSASKPFVPVAGSTDGNSPVQVQITGGASFDVSNVTISGGTLDRIADGVSASITAIAAGVTFNVASTGLLGITAQITGDVFLGATDNNIGNVDILTVAIPSGNGFTSTSLLATAGNTSTANQTFPARQFETGFRVTNFGPNTVYLGNTYNTGYTSTGENSGYPLQKFNSIFIEATGSDAIKAATLSGTADLRVVGS